MDYQYLLLMKRVTGKYALAFSLKRAKKGVWRMRNRTDPRAKDCCEDVSLFTLIKKHSDTD